VFLVWHAAGCVEKNIRERDGQVENDLYRNRREKAKDPVV